MEEVLWAIFTHYTLVGNPRDPSRLNNTGLLKLCKDGITYLKMSFIFSLLKFI